MKNIYGRLKEMLKKEPAVKFAAVVEGRHQGMQILWSEKNFCCTGEEALARRWIPHLEGAEAGICVCLDEERIFVQRYISQPELVILGGGHISRALAALGKTLGFRVTVADDREEFAAPEWFPEADQVLCGEYSEIFGRIP